MDTNKQDLEDFEKNKADKAHPSQKKDIFRAILLSISYDIKTGKVSTKFEKYKDFESDGFLNKLLPNKFVFLFALSILFYFCFD